MTLIISINLKIFGCPDSYFCCCVPATIVKHCSVQLHNWTEVCHLSAETECADELSWLEKNEWEGKWGKGWQEELSPMPHMSFETVQILYRLFVCLFVCLFAADPFTQAQTNANANLIDHKLAQQLIVCLSVYLSLLTDWPVWSHTVISIDQRKRKGDNRRRVLATLLRGDWRVGGRQKTSETQSLFLSAVGWVMQFSNLVNKL